MAAEEEDPHPYRWAVEGPPIGRWRTFEGTFSNVMSTELAFAADGTGTVTLHSGISGEEKTPILWRHLGPGELWICHVVDDEPIDIAEDGDVFRYQTGHRRSDAGTSPVLMNESSDEPLLADGSPGWIPDGGFWVLQAPVAFLGT